MSNRSDYLCSSSSPIIIGERLDMYDALSRYLSAPKKHIGSYYDKDTIAMLQNLHRLYGGECIDGFDSDSDVSYCDDIDVTVTSSNVSKRKGRKRSKGKNKRKFKGRLGIVRPNSVSSYPSYVDDLSDEDFNTFSEFGYDNCDDDYSSSYNHKTIYFYKDPSILSDYEIFSTIDAFVDFLNSEGIHISESEKEYLSLRDASYCTYINNGGELSLLSDSSAGGLYWAVNEYKDSI